MRRSRWHWAWFAPLWLGLLVAMIVTRVYHEESNLWALAGVGSLTLMGFQFRDFMLGVPA